MLFHTKARRWSTMGAVTLAAALTAIGGAAIATTSSSDQADRLTVTISHNGDAAPTTYQLRCRPAGGNHRDAQGACSRLTQMTTWGRDLFAPVPQGVKCTRRDGGPATAHVTGHWAGRPVDAEFNRHNGCQITRWDKLVPVLPKISS